MTSVATGAEKTVNPTKQGHGPEGGIIDKVKLEAQFDPEGKFLAEEKVKEKKEEDKKDK